MPVITIENVGRLDSDIAGQRSKITFKASPGNILDTDLDTTETMDGTGCTIIPGLIDSKIDADASVSSLQLFASHGITTVIDLSSGTINSQTMRSAALEIPGLTSYLSAGSGIGSHGNEMSTTFPYREIRGISTSSEAEAIVAQDATGNNQTDFVRLIADVPGLDESTLQSAVEAAHRCGKLAVAHASQAEGYRRAARCGFDIITPVPIDEPLSPGLVTKLFENNIAVIPTLCFLRHSLREIDLPGSNLSQAMANVKRLHDAGVKICAGTCANDSCRSMAMEFGNSLHDELKLLVEAGLPNREALKAATVMPAVVFGLSDRGSLEPGEHRADLVLLDGDPLEDITATRRIRKVWIQGIEVGSDF